jgi:hypothetical protein
MDVITHPFPPEGVFDGRTLLDSSAIGSPNLLFPNPTEVAKKDPLEANSKNTFPTLLLATRNPAYCRGSLTGGYAPCRANSPATTTAHGSVSKNVSTLILVNHRNGSFPGSLPSFLLGFSWLRYFRSPLVFFVISRPPVRLPSALIVSQFSACTWNLLTTNYIAPE